jgi:hypothetical protein
MGLRSGGWGTGAAASKSPDRASSTAKPASPTTCGKRFRDVGRWRSGDCEILRGWEDERDRESEIERERLRERERERKRE